MVPFPCGRYVHGLRVVCPPSSSQPGEFGCVLEVFDFNIHPKKLPEAENTTRNARTSGRGVGNDTEGDPTRPSTPIPSSIIPHEVSYTIHTEPSTISAPGVFVNTVISKLPYSRAVRKDLAAMYSGFMIDDERVVGLKVGVFVPHEMRFVELNLRYIYL